MAAGRPAACEERRRLQDRRWTEQARVPQQNKTRTRLGPVLHSGREAESPARRDVLAGGAPAELEGIRVLAVGEATWPW